MALKCENCGKGRGYGNAVSHAKNRTKRSFKPNLQKIKVIRDGVRARVKLCTSCIQRLKKDSQMGIYRLITYIQKEQTEIKPPIAADTGVKEVQDVKKKEDTDKKKQEEALKIEDIVGKA